MADPTCVRRAWLVLGSLSLDLDSPAGGWFCQSLDLGYPTPREVVSNRPDQDGVDDRTQYMGSRVVSANITVLKGAGGRIDDVADNFAPFMVPAARPVLHYVLDRGTNPERTLTVRASGYSWPIVGANQRDIQLQFVAADPVARNPTQSSATATVATPASITSPGDLPVRPLLNITGPVTKPAVTFTGPTNSTINTIAGYVIAAGTYLQIDTVAKTAYLNGDHTQSRITSIDWLNTTWPVIAPAPAAATSMAIGGTATTGATQVAASWYDGYLT
jgi:hypothetical protein